MSAFPDPIPPVAPPAGLGPAPSHRPSLSDVLAENLLNSPAYHCPGGDGLLVAEVLDGYPQAAAARLVPGELELCRRHPELAVQIVAFFFLQTVGHGNV